MQVIVIGCGKVGSSLARELINNGHTVVIIENDAKLLANADNIDCIKIHGVPIDTDILKSAGIEHIDALCAVTSDDNVNLMAGQVAKEIFGVKRVITRIFNPTNKELFEEFGLDTICSTSLSVNAIYRAIEDEESFVDFNLMGTDVSFVGVDVADDIVGMEVTGAAKKLNQHIAGIMRGATLKLALPGMVLAKGDNIMVLTMQSIGKGRIK